MGYLRELDEQEVKFVDASVNGEVIVVAIWRKFRAVARGRDCPVESLYLSALENLNFLLLEYYETLLELVTKDDDDDDKSSWIHSYRDFDERNDYP